MGLKVLREPRNGNSVSTAPLECKEFKQRTMRGNSISMSSFTDNLTSFEEMTETYLFKRN